MFRTSNTAAVLTAFQNVADTLNALQQDADGLKAAADGKEDDAVTLDLAKKQFQAGANARGR